MNRTLHIFFVFCLLPFAALKAQYGNIEFVENKGQWDSRVKFLGQVPAGAFHIHQAGFMVLQHDTIGWGRITEAMHNHGKKTSVQGKEAEIKLRSHAYDVEFVDANQNAQIIPDKALPGYNNYFIGNDPSKWASDCKVYQGITVRNIYSNVDVRYYSHNGRIKYDLIVHPGADLSKIAIKYKGAEKLELKNKELVIKTSVGNLKELPPYSFQSDQKGRREVNCKYVLKDNIIRFDVKDYDPSTTLIIDPTLVFCSFSGSTADNWGFTATYGPDGSMYGGGIIFAAGSFTSPGAYQTVFAGGAGTWPVDIGIIKLSPDGSNRAYATYLGGNGTDLPQSLICDPQGNLIVAGRSDAPNYPVTGSGLLGTGGKFDIIITKLNAAGNGLIGSKRIGGSGDDGSNITNYGCTGNPCPTSLQRNYGDEARSEVILDGSGNIYLASCTQSTNFPRVSEFQSANAGGSHTQDAVVIKTTPDISNVTFSTYLGGSGDDAAYVLSLNPANGNLYVAGGTASNDFPGNKTGTIGASSFGNIDGFVAIISGTTLIKSTYLGTSGIDQVYGIQFDRKNFPYVTGQTTGTWPHINAAYFNNGAKQFISKLQPDLSAYVYSTTFGKNASLPSISPTAFLVDRCENVYVSGWGGGFGAESDWDYPNSNTFGLPVTADRLKQTTDGRDFYFFVLKKDATDILFGSWFGEDNVGSNNGSDHVDGGTSRFDQNGVIYQAICGNCKSFGPATFPTTPGAWSVNNPASGGGGCNLAMVKIAFNLAGVGGDVISSINGVPRDSAGCVPLTVDFSDSIQIAVSYEWNFGDGSPQVTTTTPNISHTYNSLGTFQVMLVAIDSSTCNIRDTSYVNIKVGDLQATTGLNAVKLLPCDLFRYQFNNLSIAPASRPFNDTSFIWNFGDGTPPVKAGLTSINHQYAAPGTYNVTLTLVDTAYCNSPQIDSLQIRVAALVKAQFETPPAGCLPYNAVFDNTSLAGQSFTWNFGDGSTSNQINPTHLYTTAGTYTITLIAIDSGTCNVIDSAKFTIIVSDIPTAEFSFAPDPPLENTPTSFTNLSSPDAVRFVWKFGDGDSLVTRSRAPVLHQYNATASFTACLNAYNAAGCYDSICHEVRALVVPAVDVPNAFTPLSGDINSKIFVKGFGISKARFIIWNRWGQKVFETNDIDLGWDGKFKGALQPMDVYAYTLEVEFFDGTKATKKGDITLIR